MSYPASESTIILLSSNFVHAKLLLPQFSSVIQSCLTLCDPMNRSTPGLPVHHQLLEFTQTLAHRVGDAIQPSHSLWSPSPPAPNPSQHQGLFQWVSCLQFPLLRSRSVSFPRFLAPLGTETLSHPSMYLQHLTQCLGYGKVPYLLSKLNWIVKAEETSRVMEEKVQKR